MKLTYVIDSLVASGGAEQSLAMLAAEWVKGGYEMEVVTLHSRQGLQSRLLDDGVSVTCLDAPPSRRVAALRRHLRKAKPDLVHTTLFAADITGRTAAQLAGVPFVSSLVNTSYGPEEFANPAVKSWKLHAARIADTATLVRAQGVHAVSAHVAATTGKRLRVPSEKLTVIPRARDERLLGERTEARRDAVRSSLGMPVRAPILLIAARQEFQKGIDVAIQAMESVRDDAILLVAGRPGGASQELEALAQQGRAAGRITFLGSRDDVADLLVAADVCVVPSRREGMPGTVLEAMCLGTPLVVSDIAPNREALGGDEAGWIVPLEPHDFAAAIQEALDDRTRSRPAHARQRFVESFSLEKIAQQMMDFHASAVH